MQVPTQLSGKRHRVSVTELNQRALVLTCVGQRRAGWPLTVKNDICAIDQPKFRPRDLLTSYLGTQLPNTRSEHLAQMVKTMTLTAADGLS